MRGGSHSSFYKNAVWQYGLQVVKYLLPLITLPYLTRVLEPDGYAVYAYVVAFMSFAQPFVDFGFNLSGTKSIAAAKSVEEESCITGAVTQARVILCVVAGVVVFVAALFIPITRANLGYTMLAFVAVCGKAMAPDFVFQGHEGGLLMRGTECRWFDERNRLGLRHRVQRSPNSCVGNCFAD